MEPPKNSPQIGISFAAGQCSADNWWADANLPETIFDFLARGLNGRLNYSNFHPSCGFFSASVARRAHGDERKSKNGAAKVRKPLPSHPQPLSISESTEHIYGLRHPTSSEEKVRILRFAAEIKKNFFLQAKEFSIPFFFSGFPFLLLCAVVSRAMLYNSFPKSTIVSCVLRENGSFHHSSYFSCTVRKFSWQIWKKIIFLKYFKLLRFKFRKYFWKKCFPSNIRMSFNFVIFCLNI